MCMLIIDYIDLDILGIMVRITDENKGDPSHHCLPNVL